MRKYLFLLPLLLSGAAAADAPRIGPQNRTLLDERKLYDGRCHKESARVEVCYDQHGRPFLRKVFDDKGVNIYTAPNLYTKPRREEYRR